MHKTTHEEKLAKRREHYAQNKDMLRAKERQYYADNKDRIRERDSAYVKANPEMYRKARAKSFEKNKDKERARKLAYMKQWQKSNMGKAVAKVKQYKLAKIKRTPMWADKEAIERMYIISDFLTNKLDEPHHVDHIIPLRGDFVSGLHCESNLQILTAEANRAKGNRINLGEL